MSWAVAIIEPNRDFEAERALKRLGFRVVFLAYRKLLTGHHRPNWRQAIDFIPRPLFPGYGFIELWPDQPHPDRDRVIGYAGLIEDGKRTLPGELVLCWKQRVEAGEFDDKAPEPKASKKANEPKASKKAKFAPANSPEERRRVLEQRFAAMVRAQLAVGD